ncbi:MAG TPA: DUF885 domain-containing protein [Candidatus Limnocylindrales bacterium]|nr:DUF885 domain-containing protein [Candidatus Limnocylindrales bacterium]
MSAFTDTFSAFLDAFVEMEPLAATAIGDHRHDGRWPDVSPAGREARLVFIDRWHGTFSGLDPATLTPDDAIDRDLMLGELEAMRFGETELREETWDPLMWVYLLGEGIFPLLAREFAPLADRLASVASRLASLRTVTDAAKATLVGDGQGRPVGRFQTETALEQLPGIDDLIDEAVATAAASEDPAVAALRPRLEAAASEAKAAVDDLRQHLTVVVLPGSEGEGRLGRDLFTRRMRHTMRSASLSPERILEAADTQFTAVRGEMVRLAGELWSTWRPDEPRPSEDGPLVRGVLDAIGAVHQEPGDLLDFCREENERIEAFCTERDLIGIVDEPLDIRWTPVFLRAFGGAMLISPGPLDKGLTSFFAITPIPEDWTPEQRESYLREDNDRMLRLLSIHEAVPGHYLQGVYANRSASLPRSIFQSGLFAEGWAVYVTQVMMDVGYGADDPALLLTHWKFYLRSITNAMIDSRIHCDDMTEEEAVSLMVDGGFQEEAEARAKFRRARLSSTQLSTYFAGSMEMWDIELEARRRAAAAVGEDPTALEPGGLPGGLGDTPAFRYRDHLEAVISHGAPPTSLLRRAMFG